MVARSDTFELGGLRLSSGQGRRLDLTTGIEPIAFGGQEYAVGPSLIETRIDLSRTTSNGWAMRLRFEAELVGACARCLTPATPTFDVDALEVHQPGGGEELTSPYIDAEEDLDLAAWARDALVLALPVAILCSPDCAGLCPVCGVDLNEAPAHEHETGPDPRWAKLAELKFDEAAPSGDAPG